MALKMSEKDHEIKGVKGKVHSNDCFQTFQCYKCQIIVKKLLRSFLALLTNIQNIQS